MKSLCFFLVCLIIICKPGFGQQDPIRNNANKQKHDSLRFDSIRYRVEFIGIPPVSAYYWQNFPKVIMMDNAGNLMGITEDNVVPLQRNFLGPAILGFEYQSRDLNRNEFWGQATLGLNDNSNFAGKYDYRLSIWQNSGITSGQVQMTLVRMWCCGNHHTVHCKPNLTSECKKIH